MIANILFVLFVASVDSETQKTGSNDTKGDSMFVEVNSQLQGIWDGLFTSLKLDKNFTNRTKVDMMTTMTETLNNISEIHFKVYENIKNITAPDIIEFNDEIGTQLFNNLSRVIEEIFVENDYFLRNNIFHPSRTLKQFYRALVGFNDTQIIIEADSTETVENTTVDVKDPEETQINDNVTKTNESKIEYEIRNKKYGLRAWRLSNLTIELENLSRTRRIFKSIRARVKRYPFVASIMILGEFVCAGSIISRHLVITAATCLQLAYQDNQFLQRPAAAIVRVGSDFTDRGGELLIVVQVTFHPKYDPVYLKNNLAILQLDRALDFNRGMKRIEYERFDRDVGHDVTILGWGDKTSYNTYNGSLETARLQVFGLEPCKRLYSERYVGETNFCAGYVDVGGGACNRDVGGPALSGSTLLGVINFGPPVCGSPNSPTVFTKVGHYVRWIDDVVLKTQATEPPPPQMSSPRASRPGYGFNNNFNKDGSNLLSSPLRVLTSLFKNLVSKGNIDLNAIMKPGEGFDAANNDINLNNNLFLAQPSIEVTPYTQYPSYKNINPGLDKMLMPPLLRQLPSITQFPPIGIRYPTTTLYSTTSGDDILTQIDKVRNYVAEHLVGEKILRQGIPNSFSYPLAPAPTTPVMPMTITNFPIRKPTEAFFNLDMPDEKDNNEERDKDDHSDIGFDLDIGGPPKKSDHISEIDDEELELKQLKSAHRHMSKKKSGKRKKSKKHKHKKKHGGHKSHKGKWDSRNSVFKSNVDKDNESVDEDSEGEKSEPNPSHYHIEKDDDDDDDKWSLGLNRRSFLDYINF